ncbi:hypothetical protein KQX54_018640 [Cotesia glomerata]|uniref:Uncharacterized protein n=1 Tax=Cotesia glomerata TaxID=32391 RepID=A0AAV7I9B7_COTGL|nr:hypothetical protein KQX54_018640 [Cotesia glomerata]
MMILEGDAACVGMDQCVNGCCLTRTALTIIVSSPQGTATGHCLDHPAGPYHQSQTVLVEINEESRKSLRKGGKNLVRKRLECDASDSFRRQFVFLYLLYVDVMVLTEKLGSYKLLVYEFGAKDAFGGLFEGFIGLAGFCSF